MPNVWMVRADFGRYASEFLNGGYAAIGWLPDHNLASITARAELRELYLQVYLRNAESNIVVGQQVGQIHRFLLQIMVGDYVITTNRSNDLHYGKVTDTPYFYAPDSNDGCPFYHRREVAWAAEPLQRSQFSASFQASIRGQLTVFQVRHVDEFLRVIGAQEAPPLPPSLDLRRAVLERLLRLDPTEFEFLIGDLMAVIGFEPEVTPQSNDNGIDVRGELDLQGLATVKVVVQVKRYQRGHTINATTIRAFRGDIPDDYQSAFITTSSFQEKAKDEAKKDGFKRIRLIDGIELVNLLNEHWEHLVAHWNNNADPESTSSGGVGFEQKLGLKRGLVLA